MIGSTRSVRVFAYTMPTDMRKGFDGLYGMVSSHLEQDPLWSRPVKWCTKDTA